MKHNDVVEMMKILSVNYPQAYKGMSLEERRAEAANWAFFFKDYDKEIVNAALQNYIKSNSYPPTVAGLQKQLDLLTTKPKMNAEEEWAAIERATRNGIYGSEEEFEKLPPVAKAFIGNPEGLKELAMTDSGTVETVTRGQFFKQAEAIRERLKARESLSEEIKKKLKD